MIELKTREFKIVINSLEYPNRNAYIVHVNDDTAMICLDDDHVARELQDAGIDESTIDFLIKNL
jgi:hypothetical protein